ncbi:hypothetical protein C9975_03085 [Thalassospira xiamenensis]|nr:hypothetical protein C9975_03085 [Thalassospira xiamenensis]
MNKQWKDELYESAETPEQETSIDDFIKGMSPFVFIICFALLVIPHLISASENSPFYSVWAQLLNPVTMYVLPILGMLISATIGLPTRRQFFVSLTVSAFGITSMMTAFYFLHWAAALAAFFIVIIPASVWGFHRVMHHNVG